MKPKIDIQHLLPVNTRGSENNVVSVLVCNSETEAFDKFRRLSQKLLQINDWKVNAGKNPTDFYIYNKEDVKSAIVQLNDLIKIKMPAPKNKLGNGFDWVIVNKIEAVEQTQTRVLMLQLKPHSCAENNKSGVAHFYKEQASNTFVLAKSDKTLQFSIHGRNELPNLHQVGFTNSIRNFFVANGGILGGSKVQWQEFTEEFINKSSII